MENYYLMTIEFLFEMMKKCSENEQWQWLDNVMNVFNATVCLKIVKIFILCIFSISKN
jgi:hypothetical protein